MTNYSKLTNRHYVLFLKIMKISGYTKLTFNELKQRANDIIKGKNIENDDIDTEIKILMDDFNEIMNTSCKKGK